MSLEEAAQIEVTIPEARGGHGHSHHGHGGKADLFTGINTLNEIGLGLLSSYPLATAFNAMTGLKKWHLGVSPWSMAFGSALGIFSTAGSAYCHRILNTLHQDAEQHPLITPDPSLSWKEKVALVADGIGHTLDNAGLPITIAALIFSVEVVEIPAWGEALLNAGLLAWGALSAVADVRTCANSLRRSHG